LIGLLRILASPTHITRNSQNASKLTRKVRIHRHKRHAADRKADQRTRQGARLDLRDVVLHDAAKVKLQEARGAASEKTGKTVPLPDESIGAGWHGFALRSG